MNGPEKTSYLEDAFRFSEQGKANVLYEHLQSQEALKNTGIDSSSLTLFRDVSEEITYLERQLHEGAAQDSLKRQTLQKRIIRLKRTQRFPSKSL